MYCELLNQKAMNLLSKTTSHQNMKSENRNILHLRVDEKIFPVEKIIETVLKYDLKVKSMSRLNKGEFAIDLDGSRINIIQLGVQLQNMEGILSAETYFPWDKYGVAN
jgi:hypothetical protein